jgi:hypothetical protein
MQDIEGGTMARIANSQPNHLEVHVSILKLWMKNLQYNNESSLTMLWIFYKRKLLLIPCCNEILLWRHVKFDVMFHIKNANLMERRMEQVWKEIYTSFTRHLLICDIALQGGFLTRNISTLWNEFAPKVVDKKFEILVTNNG